MDGTVCALCSRFMLRWFRLRYRYFSTLFVMSAYILCACCRTPWIATNPFEWQQKNLTHKYYILSHAVTWTRYIGSSMKIRECYDMKRKNTRKTTTKVSRTSTNVLYLIKRHISTLFPSTHSTSPFLYLHNTHKCSRIQYLQNFTVSKRLLPHPMLRLYDIMLFFGLYKLIGFNEEVNKY